MGTGALHSQTRENDVTCFGWNPCAIVGVDKIITHYSPGAWRLPRPDNQSIAAWTGEFR